MDMAIIGHKVGIKHCKCPLGFSLRAEASLSSHQYPHNGLITANRVKPAISLGSRVKSVTTNIRLNRLGNRSMALLWPFYWFCNECSLFIIIIMCNNSDNWIAVSIQTLHFPEQTNWNNRDDRNLWICTDYLMHKNKMEIQKCFVHFWTTYSITQLR